EPLFQSGQYMVDGDEFGAGQSPRVVTRHVKRGVVRGKRIEDLPTGNDLEVETHILGDSARLVLELVHALFQLILAGAHDLLGAQVMKLQYGKCRGHAGDCGQHRDDSKDEAQLAMEDLANDEQRQAHGWELRTARAHAVA